jgi:hypothetical protein
MRRQIYLKSQLPSLNYAADAPIHDLCVRPSGAWWLCPKRREKHCRLHLRLCPGALPANSIDYGGAIIRLDELVGTAYWSAGSSFSEMSASIPGIE